jgi:hypothetical protein
MWWIIPIIFSLLIIYFLFAPIYIEMNSTAGLFRVRFHRIASSNFLIRNDSLFLNLKIGWWNKEFDLLKGKEKADRVKKITEVQKARRKKSIRFPSAWKKIKGIVRSFRIRECYITIDTGDMPLNGILYPWFYLFSKRIRKIVMINFQGENTVILQINNSLARMLWAYIKS